MMKKPLEIAVYGKGGIGKSTISANVSMALAKHGSRVLQIGCDPKHDSTQLLMHGESICTVLDYLKDHDKHQGKLEDVLYRGALDIGCVEAGGPRPGVGCAGRGIISAFEFLEIHHAKEQYDHVVYDVLGDVVCGGFAVPVRREYADAIFLVTSGEYMAIYAANNILRGIRNYDHDTYRRVAGIIFNERKLVDEEGRISRFAAAVGLPIVARVPRSHAFAEAEETKCTVMELKGYSEEQQVFMNLADRICNRLELYPARPLEDEQLEQVVLGGKTDTDETDVDETDDYKREENNKNNLNNLNSVDHVKVELLEHIDFEKPDENENHNSSASGLNVLKDNDNVPQKRPPLYGCAFNGAATASVHLTDAKIIAHAPRSCAFFTWQNISSPGRKNLFNRGILMPSAISPNFACTDMRQTEAVFGGTEKLRETVLEAMEEKPGAIVVISSCVSGIIGDDVKSLKELSTPELPVITIEADGVIAGDYMQGIRLSMQRIAEELIDIDRKPESRRVNLINETGVSNNVEVNFRIVRDLLEKLDIQINARFLGDTSCRDMKNFLDAPLNILAADSPDGIVLKEWLIEKYHCKFSESTLPIGFEKTRDWLYEIAKEFECEDRVPSILQEEEKKYQDELARMKPYLQGKKLLMTTINSNMDWLLETVDALGMEVTWIGVLNYLRMPLHISNYDKFQRIASEEVSLPEIQFQIEKSNPDIIVTNYTSLVKQGDYVTDSLSMTQEVGFHSGLRVIERWVELLEKKTAGDGRRKGGWQDDEQWFEKYYG